MRLIDADALKKHYAWWDDDRQKLFDSIVDSQPTVDAVPVIRCKDCKHWQKSVINYNEYVCYWGGYVKQEDDYCSWGKRKEE